MDGSLRPTILVLTPVPQDLREGLSLDYDLVDYDRSATPQKPAPGIRIALTTSMAGADAALMDALPDLGLIACQGVGLDRIDLAAAAERGVTVAHTPDVLTEDTADLAIALIYAVARGVVSADRFVRAGRWARERMIPSRRVAGKIVGIVGLGRIGQSVARKADGLGLAVLYSGPRAKEDVAYRFVADVADLAREADFLVLTCPGGPSTHHLVDARVLSQLGPEGILINIARGSVVDEAALIEALRSGRIAGAGLDVFATEPNLDPAFLDLENVVLQPHAASITYETRRAIISRLRDAIATFVNNQKGGTI